MVKLITITKMSTTECQLIRITDDVRKAVEGSGIKNGVVFIITAHTTTGIMINESLPCLEKDILNTMERIIPTHANYAHNHFLPSYGAIGGNTPGHLKSMLSGNHCVVPLISGNLVLGDAQDIYLAEFDGVQMRKVYIEIMGEE